MAYQFIGYIYYTGLTLFLIAHWLFGFAYLFTALNLNYQLQIQEKMNEYEAEGTGTRLLSETQKKLESEIQKIE